MRQTFPVRLQRVFILFRWNLARMFPDNVAKNLCRGIFIFGLLRKLWVFKQRQCVFYKNLKFNSVKKQTRQVIKIPRHGFLDRGVKKTYSICETTYFWEMIAILGKGFISCLISSNNRNLQLLSFQKIYTLLGVLWNVWPWSSDYARLSFGVRWYLKTHI